MKKLPFDIENLILKINAHFSCSVKRLNYLKQYYETSDDYSKLLKHVPIRWLSLFQAIDRLVENIEPIFRYFREEEKDDDLDIIICEFIEINTKSENLVTLPELYLYFTHQYMRIFNGTILLLEKNSLNSTHLYSIYFKLRSILLNRKNELQFGRNVETKLVNFSQKEKKDFFEVAVNTYERAIKYIDNYFDSNKQNFYLKLQNHDLERNLNHKDLIEICKSINLVIDYDKLYDECVQINYVMNNFNSHNKGISHDLKWGKLLQLYNCPNLEQIIEIVLVIPIGNDYVERIFSVMKKVWKDDRNHLNVNVVKAELCVKLNFNMLCRDFYLYVKNNEELLSLVKSDKKYKRKNKE